MNQSNKSHQDAQFPQPSYPMYPYIAENEISLVDLAKILIKQRIWFIGVTAIIVLAAFVYAMTLTPLYRYVSVYQVAEQDANQPLSNIKGTLEIVDNLYLSKFIREFKKEQSIDTFPFDFNISSPENTSLILMNSDGSQEDSAQISNLHQYIATSIDKRQLNEIKQKQAQIKAQLESSNLALIEIKNSTSTNAGEIAVNLMNRISTLELQLAQLQEGKLIQLAEQTERSSRVGKSTIIILGAVLGIVLGLLSAFLSEFFIRVQKSMVKDNS